jgi:hypothetical protein
MAEQFEGTVPTESVVPDDAPAEVKALAKKGTPRVPNFDPTLGVKGSFTWKGTPAHRIVTIGDSLTHGFQSGAVFNTDLPTARSSPTSSAGWIRSATPGTGATAVSR